MIVAVGIDLVEVARVRSAYERHPRRFLDRCFHPDEVALLAGRVDIVPGLAVRFAAKEAFAKVWSGSLSWVDVWVLKEGRRPVYRVSPAVADQLRDRGMHVHLSLTHTHGFGAAVAVLEALHDHDGPSAAPAGDAA